ncbi:NUDIX hydrolase [Oribacterium sp. HCP28S3_H8]|jgi:ADP-ribose pyrophosphatase|uniref:NUDIX hydrolase n=1 Tax=Oribacterium sp. HCP28S3_H8 TaxID=3438945 RepID=UPI003F88E7E6
MLNEENQEKPVKLIERKLAYQGRILSVYDDHVNVGGHDTHWDFIHVKGAAAVLPVLPDGRLLMVRQFRHALNRFTLEIPAGKRDSEDEDYLVCAERELEEETGYRTDHMEFLLDLTPTVAFLDEKIRIYTAEQLVSGQKHWDEDEEIGVEAWSLEDLLGLIRDGKMTDGKTVAAILAYAVKCK